MLAIGAVTFAIVGNARVTRELRAQPDGERAQKVMLLTLPSGKTIPVNYWRESDVVYAASDFRWWRELRGEGGRVRVLVRGREREGMARAVEDDPVLRSSVFKNLRPTAPNWAGVLIEIRLD